MSTNLLIGVPSHRGWIRSELATSLLHAQVVLAAQGIRVHVSFQQGAVVQVARNRLVMLARSGPVTHLLMCDDDQAFPPEAVLRLLSWREDFVSAAVPCRHDRRFVIVGPKPVPGRAPLLEVEMAGTGFILLSRQCLELMVQAYGAHPFAAMTPGLGQDGCMDPDAAVGEDIAFSCRWTGLGGRIFCDPTVPVAHFGMSCVATTMAEALKAGPVQLADDSMVSGEMLAG